MLKIIVYAILILPHLASGSSGGREVSLVYAVNAGGDAHTDVYGIQYRRDFLTSGIASNYGMQLAKIGRLMPQDEVLCRTERYGTSTFGYDIPVVEDGQYALVMLFCEVYFRERGQKVFNVHLNGRHVILEDLDIFAVAGYGVAHQEVVPFEIKGGLKTLVVDGKASPIKDHKVKLEFVKGQHDNPKINAFYIIKGNPADIPPLPSMGDTEWLDDDEFAEWYDTAGTGEDIPEGYERHDSGRKFRRSGPVSTDPWENASYWDVCKPLVVSSSLGLAAIASLYKLFRKV